MTASSREASIEDRDRPLQHVLFISRRNAGRTHMATAWFNALAYPGKARAESAGLEPATTLLPGVLTVMREVTLDVGLNLPRLVTPAVRARFDLVIAFAPDADGLSAVSETSEYDDVWLVDDPAGKPLDHVRTIRGDVELLVRKLLRERGWMPFGASVPPAAR